VLRATPTPTPTPTWTCTVRDSTCYTYYVAATSSTTTTWLATSLQDYSYIIFRTEDEDEDEESTEDKDFFYIINNYLPYSMYWLKPYVNVDKKTSSKGERGLLTTIKRSVYTSFRILFKGPIQTYMRKSCCVKTHRNTAPQ